MKPSIRMASSRLISTVKQNHQFRVCRTRQLSTSPTTLFAPQRQKSSRSRQRDDRTPESSSSSSSSSTRQGSSSSSSEPNITHVSPLQTQKTATSSLQHPSHLTPSALITNHIATASATPAANRATILAAHAHLARRDAVHFGFDSLLAKSLRNGRVVRFADNDERLRAVALAQEQADATAMQMSVRKKTDVKAHTVGFQAAPRRYRDEIVDRVAKGAYGMEHQQQQSRKNGGAEESSVSLMSQIGRRLSLNGTFTKRPGDGFVQTIKRLLPQMSKS